MIKLMNLIFIKWKLNNTYFFKKLNFKNDKIISSSGLQVPSYCDYN